MIVLNIDDDADDREIFFDAIQTIDPKIECILLGDAVEAQKLMVNRLLPQKPDYIFLDINMPKMNGFELLEIIKQDEEIGGTPVCIYSTSNNQKEVEKVNSLGARYMQKQCDFTKTVNLLSSILAEA